MEVGCQRHPGASTIGSQLLDGDRSHGWQIQATQPWAPTQKEKKTQALVVTLIKQWKEREGQGRGHSLQGVPMLRRNANAQKTSTKLPTKLLWCPMDQEHKESWHMRISNKPLIAQVKLVLLGLLQQMITWYKIRHVVGQAHYYSCAGTLEQRDLNHSSLTDLCFTVPVQV